MGVGLFDRHGRSVKLNDKGALFLQNIRNVITGIDAAVGTVMGMSSYHTGTVSLGVFVPFTYVSGLIASFAESNPAVTFEINGHIEEASSKRIQAFDLVFFPDSNEFAKTEGKILEKDPMGIAMHYLHAFAQKRSLKISELSHEKFVFLNNSPYETAAIRRCCEQAGFTADVRFTCNSAIGQKQLISSGLAVGFVRAGYREEYTERGDISCVPLDNPQLTQTVFYTSKRSKHLSAVAQAFVEHVEASRSRN